MYCLTGSLLLLLLRRLVELVGLALEQQLPW